MPADWVRAIPCRDGQCVVDRAWRSVRLAAHEALGMKHAASGATFCASGAVPSATALEGDPPGKSLTALSPGWQHTLSPDSHADIRGLHGWLGEWCLGSHSHRLGSPVLLFLIRQGQQLLHDLGLLPLLGTLGFSREQH